VKRPPWLLRRLLELVVPEGPAREGLAGDLVELYAERIERQGWLGATWWYAVQVTSAAVHYLPGRVATAVRPRPVRGEASGAALSTDLRQAVRAIRRGGGTVRLTMVCLAVGIGLSAAAFSVVESVLLRPLPFEGGDRLTLLSVSDEARGLESAPMTWAELAAARGVPAVAGAEAYAQRSFTVRGPDRAERVAGATVTPGLFALLGVEPLLGRGFLPGEGAEAGFEDVVVIGEGLWRRQFGGSSDALGRTLTLNDRALEVVGVLPASVRFPSDQEVWLPLGTRDPADAVRRYLNVVARLAPGASVAAAGEQLEPLAARIGPTGLEAGERVITARSLRDAFVPASARRFLPLLLAGVGLLLLVACANVANLLLARSLDRDRELALRSALGASRWALGWQLVLEVALMAGAAAAVGLGIAWLWLRLLRARLPDELPYWVDPGLSPEVGVFVLGATAAAALLSVAAPAVRLIREPPGDALRTRHGRGPGFRRLRASLVAGEVALSLVLLVGAGLLVRSFVELTTEDIGFDDDRVASFRLVLAGDAYDDPAARLRYYDEVVRRVAGLPEIAAAAATTAIPAADAGPSRDVSAVGSEGGAVAASLVGSSAELFGMLGVSLVAGRGWTAGEAVDTAAAVAIVGEALARRLWPDGDALDREIEVERLGRLRVVGVAEDLQYQAPMTASPLSRLQLHVPLARTPWRGMAILVVTRATPRVDAIRRAAAAADPQQAPFDFRTLPARRGESSGAQRLFASVFAELGAVALLLALAGVYGTVGYDVRRRERELGVRMALGATGGGLLRRVLLRTGALAALGVLAGLLGVAGGGRLLRGLLYGVDALDPLVLAAVSAALLGTTILAALVPAIRAARVQPLDVLRSD
jgi:putative ABC transport system permease protein